MRKNCTTILAIICVSLSAVAGNKTATVTPLWLHDGDTFCASLLDRAIINCRLYGVDAPEIKQPWGEVARSALFQLIHKKQVTITQVGTSYQRAVVRVYVNNKDVALEMLKMGLAWVTPEFNPPKEYFAAENAARSDKRGLWSDKKSINPKIWRKQKYKEK